MSKGINKLKYKAKVYIFLFVLLESADNSVNNIFKSSSSW